jgi:hypothetical protein
MAEVGKPAQYAQSAAGFDQAHVLAERIYTLEREHLNRMEAQLDDLNKTHTSMQISLASIQISLKDLPCLPHEVVTKELIEDVNDLKSARKSQNAVISAFIILFGLLEGWWRLFHGR